jgi:hypothetical protein
MDCRDELSATGIYDNAANILLGIKRRDADPTKGGGVSPFLVRGLTQAQRVPGYTFNYRRDDKQKRQNFTIAYQPYYNQAHHIVPCEVFYDDKWTPRHLHVVLSASPNPDAQSAKGYDINNKDNIILLPQCHGLLYRQYYHMLPDHSKNHSNYNKRVVGNCDAIYDMVDKALNEKDCEKKKDQRKQIYDKLKQIEKSNFRRLIDRGAKSMK